MVGDFKSNVEKWYKDVVLVIVVFFEKIIFFWLLYNFIGYRYVVEFMERILECFFDCD